jgi:drug/metabolite transporter (DMT)-like permease
MSLFCSRKVSGSFFIEFFLMIERSTLHPNRHRVLEKWLILFGLSYIYSCIQSLWISSYNEYEIDRFTQLIPIYLEPLYKYKLSVSNETVDNRYQLP